MRSAERTEAALSIRRICRVDLPCSEQVGPWVEDQDRAKESWTETVGFDLIEDAPYSMGEGAPEQGWIEVAHTKACGVSVPVSRNGSGTYATS
jgi:hypothetical protein